MRAGISVLLTSACVFLSVETQNLLYSSAPDAFQVFARFSDLVAISDSNNDTVMECLALQRTELNLDVKTATYVFLLKGHHGTEKKNVTFYVTEGPTSDKFLYHTAEDPERSEVGIISYTNYINCYVVDGPFHSGQQCVLFVSKGTEDAVPAECSKKFGDICGATVSLYNRDLCSEE